MEKEHFFCKILQGAVSDYWILISFGLFLGCLLILDLKSFRS